MARISLILSVCTLAMLTTTWGQRAPAHPPQTPKGDRVKVLNRARIYHPSVFNEQRRYAKIGLVCSRTVLNATPEYREIQARGLNPTSAQYRILVKKASDRFKRLLRLTASSGGYDLIAEKGAVAVPGKTLPEITQEVLTHMN